MPDSTLKKFAPCPTFARGPWWMRSRPSPGSTSSGRDLAIRAVPSPRLTCSQRYLLALWSRDVPLDKRLSSRIHLRDRLLASRSRSERCRHHIQKLAVTPEPPRSWMRSSRGRWSLCRFPIGPFHRSPRSFRRLLMSSRRLAYKIVKAKSQTWATHPGRSHGSAPAPH